MLVRFRSWERRLDFFGVKHEAAKDHVFGDGDDAKSAKENPPMDPIVVVVVVVVVVLGVECYHYRGGVDFPHTLFQGKLSPSLILPSIVPLRTKRKYDDSLTLPLWE